MTTVSFQLEDGLYAKLVEVADNQDRSKSSVIRRALIKYLGDQEDLDALERSYDDYLSSSKKTLTLKEVKEENDL